MLGLKEENALQQTPPAATDPALHINEPEQLPAEANARLPFLPWNRQPLTAELTESDLRNLSISNPERHNEIQQHPNCTQELFDWINAQRTPVQAEPASALSEPEWTNWFQQNYGREPYVSELQAAQAAGHVVRQRANGEEKLKQLSQGAKQFAAGTKDFYKKNVAPTVEKTGSGAKDFYASKVVPSVEKARSSEIYEKRILPAANGAVQSVQKFAAQQQSDIRTDKGRAQLMRYALPALALLGIIALLLPIGKANAAIEGMDFSLDDAPMSGRIARFGFFEFYTAALGGWLLFFMLLVLVTGALRLAKPGRIITKISLITGLIVGVITMIISFTLLDALKVLAFSAFGFSADVSVGAGTILLIIVSVLLSAAAIANLVLARKRVTPPVAALPGSAAGTNHDELNQPHTPDAG